MSVRTNGAGPILGSVAMTGQSSSRDCCLQLQDESRCLCTSQSQRQVVFSNPRKHLNAGLHLARRPAKTLIKITKSQPHSRNTACRTETETQTCMILSIIHQSILGIELLDIIFDRDNSSTAIYGISSMVSQI